MLPEEFTPLEVTPDGEDDSAVEPQVSSEEPNELTRKTFEAIDRGEGLHRAKDLQD